jgi:ATP-dependent DNA ligase
MQLKIFSPMLASSLPNLDTLGDRAWAVEPKLDGIRVIATVDAAKGWVSFQTRNGKPITTLGNCVPDLIKLANAIGKPCCFDCEAIAGSGFYDGAGKLMKKDGTDADGILAIFDLPWVEGWKATDLVPYSERRRSLTKAFDAALVGSSTVKQVPIFDTITTDSIDPEALVHKAISLGWEGVILKDIDAPYYQGKRSKAWIKLKGSETYDCPIVGFVPGKGRYDGAAGAILVNYQGTVVAVGSGLSDELRLAINDKPQDYIGKLAEVQCQEITPNGSMRHPTLVKIRWDK